MLKKLSLAAVFCMMLMTAAVHAQIIMPQPSPSSTITQQVGLTDISIAYSRPSAKGRTIFGDLVPYDKVWRTGANAATKITISDDLMVEGKKLPKGAYAMFTIPGKEEWTIIFSSKAEQNGSFDYNEADDALRIKVTPEKVSDKVESFTIMFSNITETSADISLLWENTRATFTIEDTDVDAQVMQQIDQMMNGEIENYYPYFQAAYYYFAHDKDPDKTLEWANKAAMMGADKYWVLHLQAKVNAKQGNKKVALEAAQRSKELAKEAGNPEYVAYNEKIISELKK